MADDRDFKEDKQPAAVNYEADRSELISRLCEIHPEIPAAHVSKIVKSYGGCLAWLLHEASNDRLEVYGGIIIQATPVKEHKGKDPQGKEYTEEAHYRIDAKCHQALLDEFSLLFDKPCKNG